MPGAISSPAATRASAARIRAAGALALVLATLACGSASAAGAPVTLRGRVLGDTMVLALPEGIVADEGRVVVQDAHPPPALRVVAADGQPLAAVGGHGSGPGEFGEPIDLFARPGHPGELWVFDPKLARLTPMLLDRAGRPRLRDPLTLAEPVVIEAPRWLDASTLVAQSGMLRPGEGRFALYSADGTLRRTVGAPPPGNASIRPFIRQQAYGGKIAVNPRRPLFVLASRYAGRLEVFGRDGRLVRRFRVPDAFEPDFAPARDGINMERGRKFRFGYIDVAATADRIYALFSGKRQRDPDPNFGDLVHVFDWNGRLLGTLRLDAPAFRIAVDRAGTRLYAVRHEPEPQLIGYDLRGLPR